MSRLKVLQPGESAVAAPAAERRQWRSPEERAGSPELLRAAAREFPPGAEEAPEGIDRRRFLQLAGASAALAGLAGCTQQPPEKIVPYIRQPEEIVPGEPLFFATAMTLGGYALPLLAESHMGRPTKVEGNPDHPASLGASDLFAQASVLGLYDPDRAQAITHFGQLRSWGDFAADMQASVRALEGLGGAGLRILSGAVSSPTLLAQLRALLERLPEARWHVWEPAMGNAYAGARLAFGEAVETHYKLAEADVVLALDCDLLTWGPAALTHARDFASRRRVEGDDPRLARLYAVESVPTSTGATADHRLALPPSQVAAFTLALAVELGAAELGVEGAAAGSPEHPEAARWVSAVADDLRAHRGRSLVAAGEVAPPEVHALAHAINEALGNAGTTVVYTDPLLALPQEADAADPAASLAALVADMSAGQVGTLLILGGNPVYDAPADLGFAAALEKVERRVYLGPYENETSGLCPWMVPESCCLETWGDARAHDGTVTFVQPLIDPLYDSHGGHRLLALLSGQSDATAYDMLHDHWLAQGLSEEGFRQAIHDGFLPGSAPEPRTLTVNGTAAAAQSLAQSLTQTSAGGHGGGIELSLRPDPTLHDGRFNNNAWLQECPKPLTRLTWDNALLVAPALAAREGLAPGDVVTVTPPPGHPGGPVEAPVWVLPGHPDGAATLHLGYGRARTGRVGTGTGVDAYPLRSAAGLWTVAGVSLAKTGRTVKLASTQDHFSMEGRALARSASLEQYREHPDFAQHAVHAPKPEETFFPPYEYDGYAWGMAVDLNACTGCNACVVACQAENNVPTVGKGQVLNGREMHWIRIDRYFEGDVDDPVVHQQPVMCQHCELAPCELVCPVAATVHSDEGLNDMVYNRCVGTRYCSNNCPYKVRRFNFLEYNDHATTVLAMMRNPDVTVRERGVMEKCSFCVQRINGARQKAKVAGRKLSDGDVVTACQQACPSGAIVFGDINDAGSEVSRWKARPTNYGLLEELNVRPRTSYLARVHNLNPALAHSRDHSGPDEGGGHHASRAPGRGGVQVSERRVATAGRKS